MFAQWALKHVDDIVLFKMPTFSLHPYVMKKVLNNDFQISEFPFFNQ